MKTKVGKVYQREETITKYGVCEKCQVIYEQISKSSGMENFIVTFTEI